MGTTHDPYVTEDGHQILFFPRKCPYYILPDLFKEIYELSKSVNGMHYISLGVKP